MDIKFELIKYINTKISNTEIPRQIYLSGIFFLIIKVLARL